MSRFTISLPSNDLINLYPKNKVSQWKTKLSESVELEDNWELGLMEVSFPGKVHNIYGNCFYFTVGGINPTITGELKSGTYDTIHSVIGEIQRVNKAVSKQNGYTNDIVQFRYANRYRCVKIYFTKFASASICVFLSDDFATMLGFETNKYHWFRRTNSDNEINADHPVLLTTGNGNVFVYCDLLEHVMVGDVKAPLLCIVNRNRPYRTSMTKSNIQLSIRYNMCRCRKSPLIRSTSYW